MNLDLSIVPDEKNARIFLLVATAARRHIDTSPFLLGISGAGGAGKTTLARNLVKYFGEEHALTIDLDDYLISREERGKLEITGYNPVANKLHLARQNIEALKRDEMATKPRYDHSTGLCLPDEHIAPKRVIVIEGVTTLYPELKELHNVSIFLDAPDETQIKSRISRDVNERGYSLEQALQLFQAVRPDYRRFVEPTRIFADLICNVNTEYVMTITHLSERLR